MIRDYDDHSALAFIQTLRKALEQVVVEPGACRVQRTAPDPLHAPRVSVRMPRDAVRARPSGEISAQSAFVLLTKTARSGGFQRVDQHLLRGILLKVVVT